METTQTVNEEEDIGTTERCDSDVGCFSPVVQRDAEGKSTLTEDPLQLQKDVVPQQDAFVLVDWRILVMEIFAEVLKLSPGSNTKLREVTEANIIKLISFFMKNVPREERGMVRFPMI